MIRPGFPDTAERKELLPLPRDGSAELRLARRADAPVLPGEGWSCQRVAKALLPGGDTIRTWHRLYLQDGIEGLAKFGNEGSTCRLSIEQQDKLKAWIAETLPRPARQTGAYIGNEFEVTCEGRPGLIALLHRPGMVHRKPQAQKAIAALQERGGGDEVKRLLISVWRPILNARAAAPSAPEAGTGRGTA